MAISRENLRNKPLLCYLTFPLTSDPEKNGNKAETLALQIMRKFPLMTVLVAHNSTQFMERAKKHRSILGDIQIIQKCDMLILGTPLNYEKSAGATWEFFIAKHMEKPCVTANYLLGKTRNPEGWR